MVRDTIVIVFLSVVALAAGVLVRSTSIGATSELGGWMLISMSVFGFATAAWLSWPDHKEH